LKVVVGLRGLSKNVNRYFCKNEGVWLCAGQKEAYDAILLQVALKTAFRAASVRLKAQRFSQVSNVQRLNKKFTSNLQKMS